MKGYVFFIVQRAEPLKIKATERKCLDLFLEKACRNAIKR
jgi:hypothetical protein